MSDMATTCDLNALHAALTCKDEATIQQLHEKHSAVLKISLQQANPRLDNIGTDQVAEKLLPLSSISRPLSTPADGNCFFNAVSLMLVGSSDLAGTLRILTAIEIRRGNINYLLHPVTETAMSLKCTHQRDTHIAMLISDDEVEHTQREKGDLEALHHLAIKTSMNGYWVGFIHFLAIANVTGYKIKSSYPKSEYLCEPLKLLLNSCILPSGSEEQSAGPITIMWSQVGASPQDQSFFVPNHFVPLIDDGYHYSDDELYNEKTFAMLDPVIMSTLEPSASEWETEDNLPLTQLKCSTPAATCKELGNTVASIEENEISADEDHLSDLESVSSEEVNTDSSSGEEGDDEGDENTCSDQVINWLEPFRKINKKPFSGDKPGPKVHFGQDTNEIDLFLQFLGESFLETTASASTKYAEKYQIKIADLTSKEISAYLGIRIIMGVDPKPSIDDYWSTDSCLVNKFVSETMSRKLFRDIHRVFHVDDPEESSKSSALERINVLLNSMRLKSKELYNLHENVSVDEAMIKFHGKHSGVVGAPNKPAKRGYKVYTLADGHTGYVWDFEVYLRTAKREEGLTKRVVETLCQDITGKNHVVYVDKFYTSIPLALSLLKKKVYICGSFNTSRKQWPAKLKPQKTGCHLKKLKRGDFLSKQSADGRMVASVWKDSSLVFNLTTCYNPNIAKVSRKIRGPSGWQSVSLDTTEAIVAYNKYMGGVDRHDHLRANYTIQRAGHRWWRYFVWFLLDVSLVNSFILFKMCNRASLTQKQFRLQVAKQLVGGFSMRSHRVKQTEIATLDRSLAESHTKTFFPGRPRVCRLCSKRKVKTRGGRAKETRDGCLQCQIYLHKDCFLQYHEDACRPAMTRGIHADASTQTEESTNQESPTLSFSRHPIITTPARLRRSPRKLKSIK